MKIKASELIGPSLDWTVAKCEGVPVDAPGYSWQIGKFCCRYSTNWSQGGPIIERERIKVDPRGGNWECTIWNEPRVRNPSYGPTPLIAAMRCYVASKLGDEIEIPDELI